MYRADLKAHRIVDITRGFSIVNRFVYITSCRESRKEEEEEEEVCTVKHNGETLLQCDEKEKGIGKETKNK